MKKMPPVQFDWHPGKGSATPVYQQIVKFVCDKVASGEWPIGTRLPSQRALAEQLGVNRSTVTSAIDELTSYGVVAGCHGAGTQIVSNTWSLLLQQPAPDWGEFISSGFFRANINTIQTINRLEYIPDMIRLGTGELDPRLFPVDMLQSVMSRVSNRVKNLGYLEPLGLPELRLAISQHMSRLGVNAPPSCILVTSGALQALQLISACLLSAGSTVFTEAPSYLKSLQLFPSTGARLTGIPMDEEGIEFWRIAPLLKPNRQQNAALLYTIPTNQNPTGIIMSEQRRRDLMQFCTENRLPIIEDGAYHELSFVDTRTPLKAMDQNGTVLYLGSASKTLAPGLRIGWVIAPEPIVQRLGDVKMQTDYGASSVSQWLFTEFLTSGLYDVYLNQLKQTLRHRRDCALSVLDRYYKKLATWRTPNGGFYIWLTFKKPLVLESLFEKAIAEKILLNPGDMYDFARNNSLRLSYVYTTPEEFEQAAIKLARIIEQGFVASIK